ncbi:hypothetical protein NIA10_14630 [Agathobaculum butyriciproducens]|uniref:hypothetical protein n=1 Tax=Agathobaculum butyriciproducens TaxID=1628085 RepID=UPI002096A8A0|nr:hypothetical protein [Agathobaculum butyriciproducens]
MSATGYTTIYNEVLRDSTLSLDAKGLFAVIKSFVGLPGFALSKRRLGYACSDSGYLLNAAWKELKQKGYLQHYFSQAENGAFCHVYNLMQHPSAPVDFVYSPSIDRPNGDVICISDAQRDYTNISTAVLRDKSISLASKGLFALVSHLMKIPDFVLRPEGIRAFCIEKIKHFSTLWKRFKISGLLKQHRHPAGEENRWTYEYEICETPDLETPYLTNYHVDGSVSTVVTIDGFLEKLKKRVSRIRKNVSIKKKDKPRAVRRKERRQIEQQLNADALRQRFGNDLTGTVVTAVYNIKHADKLFIQGAEITQERRETVAQMISPENVECFLDSTTLDLSRIENPAAYLQTALFAFLESQCSTDSSPADEAPNRPLADWEQAWLAQKAEARRRREEAIARGEYQD